jgi:hypothetical protein
MTTGTISTAPVPTGVLRAWALELEVELSAVAARLATEERLERVIELMARTEGVRSAAIRLDQPRDLLHVDLVIAAGDGPDALAQAVGLFRACSRYAGLKEPRLRRAALLAAV